VLINFVFLFIHFIFVKMGTITYLKGDATQPVGDGKKIIVHICNDIGAWGAGFVLAISKRWKQPEAVYRAMSERMLGTAEIVQVEPDICVANMIAQRDVKPSFTAANGQVKCTPPIRYGAVRAALAKVNDYAYRHNATIHMPRIGCGLAGGKWDEIERIVRDTMSVDVYVYDF
jgi:O-acetyl-ADP-ribose deacetylase (regulator of RNase III)